MVYLGSIVRYVKMTAEEFKYLIHPLTYVDAAKFLGCTPRYIKYMVYGERPAKSLVHGVTKQDVLNFLKTSPDAAKSRQQLRNAVGYKEYIRLVGLEKYKCVCCLYPASQKIYNVPLCEGCVSKTKNRVIVKKKKIRSKRR